ncbi:PAS domain-containing hybrid sensor histidine kinase/response regulator [Alteromonas flava]|uniref:PAS domain-containing hybrid sensor histidine kinase/response regulator n=1 Tax=Alteromonas flava TaxID=2048003 RepID=UPI000C288AEE|nr:PAS domain-containing hybrid sensor histidine kinase/response regulator [Alteromonas flava]
MALQKAVSESYILSTLRTGVVIHAPDSSVMYCNPRASELLGLTEDQMWGRTALDPTWHFVDEFGDALPVEQYPISQALKTLKNVDNMTVGIISPLNKECIWVLVNAVPMFDNANNLSHVSINFHDISPQKAIEQQLQEQTSRYQAILHNASDAITILDSHGVTQECSDSWCDMLGINRQQAIGMPVSAWDKKYSSAEIANIIADIQKNGERVQFETQHCNANGQEYPVEVSAFPLEISGQPMLFCSTRDITERVKAEQERATRQQALEQEVTARTKELELAKTQAESASKAKTAFLANITHEIRTPLNIIIGMAHFLREDGLSGAQQTRIDTIETASRHLLEILNLVLDISKIETGKFDIAHEPINLQEVFDDIYRLMSVSANEKGLSFITDLGELPTDVKGDAIRLKQAILNLTSNAIKFTDSGTITLRVRVVADTQSSVNIRIEVEDTGIGFKPEVLPRLFNEFEQADNSLTRQYQGTGLGLSITKRIAHLMGGDVGATSTVGKGSTFWFDISLDKTASVQYEVLEHAFDPKEQLLALDSKHVLIVDDEDMNAELLAEFLTLVDIDSSTASNGVEAIEYVQNQHVDLILMDVQMPRMDGLEATRRIRELPLGTSVPIVALTGNAFEENKRTCLAAGMNGFVTKPLHLDTFYTTVFHWLTHSIE